MVKVKIFIEGGGDSDRQGRQFRPAWRDFFHSEGLAGRLPAVVRGGSRDKTFARFAAAVKDARPGELPILLVDSEGPVASGHSAWQHLQDPAPGRAGWQRPAGTSEEQAFLMVQTMETWFLADPAALQTYFGPSFRASRLPQRRDLENVPKDTVLQALENATSDCRQQYAKGTVSFEILARIDAKQVAERCPDAKRLMDYLRSL